MRFLLVILIMTIVYIGDLRFGNPHKSIKNDLIYLGCGIALYWVSFLFK